MMVECPHCYLSVLPNSDNTCPSCGKNINDVTGTDLSNKIVEIKIGEELPFICCKCGQRADENVIVKETMSSSKFPVFLRIIFLFFRPLYLLVQDNNSKNIKLQLKMPICKMCKEVHEIKPSYVDFQNNKISFIVNSNFREELYKKRRKEQE
ncbi:MAG: hypothetical protein Q8900_11235 [Bacillota bacterium]|nr:hypothetical protein [Bacillota bacterium]